MPFEHYIRSTKRLVLPRATFEIPMISA